MISAQINQIDHLTGNFLATISKYVQAYWYYVESISPVPEVAEATYSKLKVGQCCSFFTFEVN
jgi:hypothetical protein